MAVESIRKKAHSNQEILESNRLTVENTNALAKELLKQFEMSTDFITRDMAALNLNDEANLTPKADHNSSLKTRLSSQESRMEIELSTPLTKNGPPSLRRMQPPPPKIRSKGEIWSSNSSFFLV